MIKKNIFLINDWGDLSWIAKSIKKFLKKEAPDCNYDLTKLESKNHFRFRVISYIELGNDRKMLASKIFSISNKKIFLNNCTEEEVDLDLNQDLDSFINLTRERLFPFNLFLKLESEFISRNNFIDRKIFESFVKFDQNKKDIKDFILDNFSLEKKYHKFLDYYDLRIKENIGICASHGNGFEVSYYNFSPDLMVDQIELILDLKEIKNKYNKNEIKILKEFDAKDYIYHSRGVLTFDRFVKTIISHAQIQESLKDNILSKSSSGISLMTPGGKNYSFDFGLVLNFKE